MDDAAQPIKATVKDKVHAVDNSRPKNVPIWKLGCEHRMSRGQSRVKTCFARLDVCSVWPFGLESHF